MEIQIFRLKQRLRCLKSTQFWQECQDQTVVGENVNWPNCLEDNLHYQSSSQRTYPLTQILVLEIYFTATFVHVRNGID